MDTHDDLDKLIERLRQLPESEREAYLQETVVDDTERKRLSAQLVEINEADAFFGDDLSKQHGILGAKGNQAGLQTEETASFVTTLAADFPELEIIDLIGRGGMGAVFKARQQSLDRVVALKVLPSAWNASGSFRERFEREAKALASLNHPNIVTIYEFGERNGRFFFTMEFVDGTDLARMLHGGELEPEMALKLIPPICDAIQCAHDRGLVHRDIKPGNILVDRAGRVKVADFGIAKLGNIEESAETAKAPTGAPADLTGPHGILGTPRYMAPEQACASGEVDHRADLYALGVVFYEMLAGSPPAPGEVTNPPSSIQGKVDRRWDEMVLRALEQDPDRRYQNATEIKTAVESILAEQSRRVPRWVRGAALPAMALVLAGLVYLWPRTDAKDQPLINSLEMNFVPVPGVEGLVSVWETRVKDYAVFLQKTGRSPARPRFEQTEDHPVVQVSWHDAWAFCQWLTEREHRAGLLPESEVYRLPTDREWSAMAHLSKEEGATPQERHLRQETIYPWGEESPVPEGAGNYPDLTASERMGTAEVTGYEDGFAATAPVGRFQPTADGLYDLGGNTWEWTATPFSPDDGQPAVRGGGWWADTPDDEWKSLLASFRRSDVEATETDAWDVGFRVVRGPRAEAEADSLFALILSRDTERLEQANLTGAEVNAINQAGQLPVVAAAEAGNLSILQWLHEHGADLDASDERGRTALHAASEIGHTAMVQWLLDHGVGPRPSTLAGEEPLFLAMRRAPVQLLDLLLAAGGPEVITQIGPFETDLLVQASFVGLDETVAWVLDHMPQDHVREASPETLKAWASMLADRRSALLTEFLALRAGAWNFDLLRMAMIVSINTGQENGFTRLMDAARGGPPDPQILAALGELAVGQGRPWAIEALEGAGWDPTAHQASLLHLTVNESRRSTFTAVKRVLDRIAPNRQKVREQVLRTSATWPAPATRETIRLLVDRYELDLEVRDKSEQTPLIRAAWRGDLDAVETFLDLGADIEAKDDLEFTPLLCAVEKGHLEVVKLLERRKANFEAVNQFGRGVLHVAVSRRDEILRYLLAKDPPPDVNLRDNEFGATPLISLAEAGDEGILSLLLDAGADVDAAATKGEWAGHTALIRACSVFDDQEQAKHAADNVLRGFEMAPMPHASLEERLRLIRLLVDAGANPMARSTNTGNTALHIAASSGLAEAVQLFLERGEGEGKNAINNSFDSPLHLAALAGQLECVQVLLEHDAVLDSPVFPFSLATAALNGGNPALLELLLKRGAPTERTDPAGTFPIHLAAGKGQAEMVEILIDNGADPNVRELQFRTPLHYAALGNRREVADLLWSRGANLNAVDSYNCTPEDLAPTVLAPHLKKLARRPSPKPSNPDPGTDQ